jgi:hypothetical protein
VVWAKKVVDNTGCIWYSIRAPQAALRRRSGQKQRKIKVSALESVCCGPAKRTLKIKQRSKITLRFFCRFLKFATVIHSATNEKEIR